MDAVAMIAQVEAGERGGNNNPYGIGGKSSKQADIVNHNNIMVDDRDQDVTQGTSTTYTMRRLAKDAPELPTK